MKYATVREANKAFEIAHDFEKRIPGGRIIIYGEHTDGAGKNARFWLCHQAATDAVCRFSVGGQRYLDLDGQWREPHGQASRRHFSTPHAAQKAAEAIQTV